MPFLPKTDRDSSALLELQLAEQLRKLNPAFDVTRVDLSPFPTLRAKIDCLTISQQKGISGLELEQLRTVLSGTVARPNEQPRIATIHDPSQADLKHLLAEYPSARIAYLEVAVDVFLPEGSNDLYLLRQLKEQLRHCIAPQKHSRFTDVKRLFWNSTRNQRSSDSAANPTPLTTVYYKSPKDGLSLKMYIKTLDQGIGVDRYYLRTELALSSTACEWAELDCVAALPAFGKKLRSYASKAFFIGSGFKVEPVDRKKWSKYGAVWAINESKGLEIQPDAQANRRFGDALNDLGRSLQRLAP